MEHNGVGLASSSFDGKNSDADCTILEDKNTGKLDRNPQMQAQTEF